MRAIVVVVTLVIAGCPSETTTPADLSAAVVDMAQPPDLGRPDSGGDGGVFNCRELNACTTACRNQACVTACRARASMAAVMKEMAVQMCFNAQCPQVSDMGMAICMRDGSGNVSTACQTCVDNTQKPANMTCTGNPPECHQCVTQVADCVKDA